MKNKRAVPHGLPFGLPVPPADRVQRPAGISLCMIVKNEERFLPHCLESVAGVVDEIVIVDTGSSDRTIDIARSAGAIVLEREWRDDFAWARNQALEMATKRWILVLDADEQLEAQSKAALEQLKNVPAFHDALWVRCYNESDDYQGTGAMSHVLVRVFPNDPRIRYRGLIHEYPTLDESTSGLRAHLAPVSIVHHGYLKDVVSARNKAERNLQIVRETTRREPNDPFHWFNLGSTAFLCGDFQLACDALEKMRDINAGAKRGFLANGLALLAEVYCDKLREAEKGEAVARECLGIAPHYANAHFQLGKALVAQRRFDEARAAYDAAIADEAYAHLQFVVDDQVYVWKAHSEIGSSYVAQGDDRRAAEWFRKGLARAPGVEPLQINLARCLERQGVHAEAEQLFRTAYEQHRTEQTTVDYVNVLLRRGRGAKALQIIEASCERLGDDTACALLVAASQVATKLGLRNAHEYLERAAERKPYAAEILNPLEAHYRVRRDEAALARLLERERAHAPRTALDCLRRSHQALAVGDFAAAIALAEKGIGLEGTSGKLRYNAALACARQGLKARAVEHLRHIDFQDDVYCSAQLLRAATERELGHIADALESVDRLLSRDPQNVDGLLLRASICEAMDDAHAAEASLIAAYDADRRRGGVELAAFYLRRERYGDAARVADEALAS